MGSAQGNGSNAVLTYLFDHTVTVTGGRQLSGVTMIIGSFLQGGVSAGDTALMGCLPERPGLLQSCRWLHGHFIPDLTLELSHGGGVRH